MQGFPHEYETSAQASPESSVTLSSQGSPDLSSMPPPQFGGPEGFWSPESLLTAAVADCFVLTFRAIAKASRLDWTDLNCKVTGVLDRVDGVTRFTGFNLQASLAVPAGTDHAKAERILHKSESACLVTASLNTENTLETRVREA